MDTQPTGVIVAKNGAHIDPVTKRFVKGGRQTTAIADSSQAAELARRRHERKREIISSAAAAAVERDDYRAKYGDDAWIAAIAEAAYIKATTPDDPKAIDAARFFLQETGLAEAKQPQTQGDAVTVTLSAQGLQALASMLAGNTSDNNNYRNHDIIEGEAGEAAADSGGEKQ